MPTPYLIGVAAALLLPAAAPAQPRRIESAQVAADLAYGVCPVFLAGRFPLNSPPLAEQGFATAIRKETHPSFGELEMVTAKRSDGDISFGGAPGKLCTVVVTGAKRDSALAKLRENMAGTGMTFEPVPHTGPQYPDVTVETFRAPVRDQAVYLQLIQAGGSRPSVVFQMFPLAQ
jgi:hypothetical protein